MSKQSTEFKIFQQVGPDLWVIKERGLPDLETAKNALKDWMDRRSGQWRIVQTVETVYAPTDVGL